MPYLSELTRSITAAALLCTGIAGSPATAQENKPLYDRLGGIYPIAVVVDDFVDLLLLNDVLNANPAISEARARVPAEGLKYQVTTLVCEVTGGPCKYAGRSMQESHAHLNITETEWQAMATDFKRILDNYQVPDPEQQKLFDIVGSVKGDIVTAN